MKPLFALVLAPLAAAITLSPDSNTAEDSSILARRTANATDAVQSTTFSFSQLWDLNKKLLDNFIYPADVKQAQAINSTIFAENVQGRVDITRTFDGRELNTEYIFGLFANFAAAKPGAFSLLGVPLSYEILNFAANQNVVSTLTRSVAPISYSNLSLRFPRPIPFRFPLPPQSTLDAHIR